MSFLWKENPRKEEKTKGQSVSTVINKKCPRHDKKIGENSNHTRKQEQQEVLGRTNRLFSLI
jgi:hypothetical protein